ncbi:MAG: lipopolysaccharide transport periplasmic protein LptA [Azoarcus sp.]|jgi:lipopolysaccharide export system protein LptA|nr:lipopolysaccharide transport periplasmic protein LptA [Azoarcus sp.]
MRALFAIFPAILLLFSQSASAQKFDKNLPVDIDADKVTVDDRNKVHVFEGTVVLTQGTLTIKGDKIVVTQNAAGYHHGVATAKEGRLVTFRQKRAHSDAWVDGEAERIEYDSQTERAQLFNRAQVQSAGDLVKGPYIEYDVSTENYLVTDAPGKTRETPSPDGHRVHVTIQPKAKTEEKKQTK